MERILTIGLEEPERLALEDRLDVHLISHSDLPQVQLRSGRLLVEHPERMSYVQVNRVIFHGIFEDDFDLLTALALWGGPCLPGALGLLDCRRRVNCLARAAAVSCYAALPRSFAYGGQLVPVEGEAVAKWGNWHCGDDKERLRVACRCDQPTLLEPFLRGEAVRIVLVGERFWQIRLAGDDWKKSIHHPAAAFMPVDELLLEDTRRLAARFDLPLIGVDYLVSEDGARHLLEVNHVPNVTVFPPIREAFLDLAARWAMGGRPSVV